MSDKTLSHITVCKYTPRFWDCPPSERGTFLKEMTSQSPALAESVHLYLLYPSRSEADFLLWSTSHVETNDSAAQFISNFAGVFSKWRHMISPVQTLWGFTRSSVYHPNQSPQAIDPFSTSRKPYFVVYPFSKTIEWHLLRKDPRQGMMNEHIKVGKQYPEVSQLLLYSVGLQDQEFVVSYETEDLTQFSELVHALRDTEVRRYTLKDTPIYTGIYCSLQKFVQTFGA